MSWEDLNAKYGGQGSAEGSDWEALAKKYQPKAEKEKPKAEPVTDFSGNLRFATPLGTVDTGIPLPQSVNKGLAQIGSGLSDWGLAARQLTASDKPKTATDLVTGQTDSSRLRQEVMDKRIRDQALNEGFVGKINNFAGKALPAMAVPQVGGAPFTSGMMAGGITGMMEPTAEGESRTANALMGTGAGAIVPGVAAGFRALMKPNAEVSALAQKAQQYGIPVSAADLSQNGLVKGVRSFLNDLPIVGRPGAALKEQQQQALNKAVGGQFGAAESRLTPDVMDAAKQRMGAEFDRLWGGNTLQVDAPMFQQMQALRAAAGDLPKNKAAEMLSKLDDLWSKATPNAQGVPTISGEAANKFQQWLRTEARPGSLLENELGTLRKSIIDAFNRSITPADAAALTANRAQYKAFKTVEPLLNKGATGVAGRAEGDIPAALLPAAVNQSYRNLSSQTSQPALAELAQIAGRLLVDRAPQTGGSARALAQNALGASPMFVGGAGLTAGLDAALTAGAGTAASVGVPYLANALLNSPRIGANLLQQPQARALLASPDAPAAAKRALYNALMSGTVAAPIGWLQSPALEQ